MKCLLTTMMQSIVHCRDTSGPGTKYPMHRSDMTEVSRRFGPNGLACVRQWGEVSVNRMSADVILLCSASVPTKSSASHIMTLVITSRADRHSAKISKDRNRIGKIAKIAISISISMIVTAPREAVMLYWLLVIIRNCF